MDVKDVYGLKLEKLDHLFQVLVPYMASALKTPHQKISAE